MAESYNQFRSHALKIGIWYWVDLRFNIHQQLKSYGLQFKISLPPVLGEEVVLYYSRIIAVEMRENLTSICPHRVGDLVPEWKNNPGLALYLQKHQFDENITECGGN